MNLITLPIGLVPVNVKCFSTIAEAKTEIRKLANIEFKVLPLDNEFAVVSISLIGQVINGISWVVNGPTETSKS